MDENRYEQVGEIKKRKVNRKKRIQTVKQMRRILKKDEMKPKEQRQREAMKKQEKNGRKLQNQVKGNQV